MSVEQFYQIGKRNIKISLLPHLFISILFLAVSPFLMGVRNLDAYNTAKVLEMYVALLGIILIAPIFLPEQNKEIEDLVDSKSIASVKVYFIRVLEAVCSLMLLLGAYIIILQYNNCTFSTIPYYFGTLAQALFLGGLGILAFSLSDQVVLAYMIPIVYYVACFGGAKKWMKNFYLFSMMYGGYERKVYLGITGALLIVMGIFIKYIIRKRK